MNNSTKVRAAIFSLLGGSTLLLGPVADVAQAATSGGPSGSEITGADVADKPPRLDHAAVAADLRAGKPVQSAGRLSDDPTFGFRGSIRLSPQAPLS